MVASLWQATGEEEYVVTGQLAAGAAFVTGGNAQHHRADLRWVRLIAAKM